ncbi:FAD-dependent monooxygenase [Microbacterium sp.]|uniref:FAD-dependent monooxygenase n=1 Tax=Microbacterium sp. TaxID=51671 RepID=UPI003A8612D6
MSPDVDADVLIVGAGPVGLMAAIDLSARGVTSIVIEQRAFLEPPSVKCNHVASRTMERFRMLGFADRVRRAGLPSDYPQDVAFRTSVTGREFGRIEIPASGVRGTTAARGLDTQWATPEGPQRINQTFLEPILADEAVQRSGVALHSRRVFRSLAQDDDGVTAVTVDGAGGDERALRGRYLIGADGGKSIVRKLIGASLSGDPVLQRVMSTLVRVDGLYERMRAPEPRAWGYYTSNERRHGHVYAINGIDEFLVHTFLTDAEAEEGSVDRDEAIRAILGLEADEAYEIVSKEDWVARRLIADRFRDRRVFLAGDASHLWVPFAGFGMNAGIADVLNLTWLLGAVRRGWADEGILDAYEAERWPITDQVSRFAMEHQQKLERPRLPAGLDDDGPAGAAVRERYGAQMRALNEPQFVAAGLNFGYVYDASPIIAYDGVSAPDYSMGTYTPSTVPGCRAPHFWLTDGTSVFDRLGIGYTLIAVSGTGHAALDDAFRAATVPLETIEVDRDILPAEYSRSLTLVRQDQTVVWRADEPPDDPRGLVGLLRGDGCVRPRRA